MTEPITPLTAPPGGVPALINTPEALAEAVARLRAGSGPVAVDSERASGFTYTSRAQLIQIFRRTTGLVMIDAAALPHLRDVSDALAESEWVLHAASQDLPCLRDCDMEPSRIFDTELAARLAGFPSVGLAAVVARTLGLGLAKEHSAQNWSVRPLPQEWLNYAALDVVVLLDVRDVLERELEQAGKLGIAQAEAAHVLAAPPPAPKPEAWRRTSGAHALKDPQRLAVLRSMWNARDRLAAKRDIFPGRVLPDSALVAAAAALPKTPQALRRIPPFNGRRQSQLLNYWWAALAAGAAARGSELPKLRGPSSQVTPPVRHWARRHPAAAQRMAQVKAQLAALSAAELIPVENLMQPELVRQVVFQPPANIPATMARGGARSWQIEAVAPIVAEAVRAYPDPPRTRPAQDLA
ncbi:MAG: HRDC domain-containing protein [Bifidobacteriaceae bacterium]|jgi:ribonuclease D|nr:HRDC domain-containing protein [Bifidobacteriaceae bacterium]